MADYDHVIPQVGTSRGGCLKVLQFLNLVCSTSVCQNLSLGRSYYVAH
jgi:hypothetical protein